MADDQTDYYKRNQAYLKPGQHVYNTPLSPAQELQFRAWLQQNKVPFDPAAPVTDYDMRGFWKALQSGDPIAKTAIDPNDNRLHYPDYWKTPYHETFSAESQWADPTKAPKWNDKDQLVMPDGTVIFDDKAKSAPPETEDKKSQLLNMMRQPNPQQQGMLTTLRQKMSTKQPYGMGP